MLRLEPNWETPSQMEDSKTEDQVEILISDSEKEEDSSEAKSKRKIPLIISIINSFYLLRL